MTNFDSLKQLIEATQSDIEKFDGGNKAAGTRVRAACQEIKKLAQSIRIDVQAAKNSGKGA